MCLALTKDLVNDARKGWGGVDDNTLRSIFLRSMQPSDEFSFRSPSSSAPLIFRSLVQSPGQCVKVDVQDKNSVEQVNEHGEVPRTPAEECHRLALVDD